MKRILFIIRTVWSNLRNANALVDLQDRIDSLENDLKVRTDERDRVNQIAINLTARVKMHQMILAAMVQRFGYGNDIFTLNWDEIEDHQKNEVTVDRKEDKVRLHIVRPSTAKYLVKNEPKNAKA